MSQLSIHDVAKYILVETGKALDTMKLQKLCYYTQAWRLAWTGKQLFAEDFRAWANGPVCYELFQQHRGRFSVTAEAMSLGDASTLSEDQARHVRAVLAAYGGFRGSELSDFTHAELPWMAVRAGLPDGASSSAVISKASIRDYYRQVMEDPAAVPVGQG